MSAAPDPVRLARALNDAGARYLVIGGFAVIRTAVCAGD
jgi:hypothetical protein